MNRYQLLAGQIFESVSDLVPDSASSDPIILGPKYILTDETKTLAERVLHRIKAIRDFGDVKSGDLGGWVQSENNLSHVGNCWIYNKAFVLDNAWMWDNARVFGDACVFGCARVSGNAQVYGNAFVYDYAWVYENAQVYGNAFVFDNAQVCESARVYGNAQLHGNAHLSMSMHKFETC
jgi:hypothetical protein